MEQKRHPSSSGRVIEGNVQDVCFRDYMGKIQLVAGGPPCQPFSLGGKHQAQLDARDMFPEAIRAVRESAPRAFIFENVKGLTRKAFSLYFNYILLQLTYPELVVKDYQTWEEHLSALERHHTALHADGLHYNVTYRMVNAADYGVPQNRHRVVIVGFRCDQNANWSFPSASHSQESLLYSQWITGEYWERHDIEPQYSLKPGKSRLAQVRNAVENGLVPRQPWQTVRDALKGMDDPVHGCSESRFENHVYKAGARIYAGHSGSNLDLPSKALKAGVHGVPGGENMMILDDGTPRYYTVREAARIQTFPDSFEFVSSWSESMRQLGNAVPVKLASILGHSIRERLCASNAQKKTSDLSAV